MRQALIALIAPSGDARSWEATAELSRVIRQEGSTLTEMTIDAEGNAETATITDQAVGVMAINEDATRLYFASKADLDGSGDPRGGPNEALPARAQPRSCGGNGRVHLRHDSFGPPANKTARAGR